MASRATRTPKAAKATKTRKTPKTKGFKVRAHASGRMVSAQRPGTEVGRHESVATVKHEGGQASVLAPFDAVVSQVHVPKGKPFRARSMLVTLHQLIRAQAAGVLDWIVGEGRTVQPADTVAIISGAGQQHFYSSGVAGTVVNVRAAAGDDVALGQPLMEIA